MSCGLQVKIKLLYTQSAEHALHALRAEHALHALRAEHALHRVTAIIFIKSKSSVTAFQNIGNMYFIMDACIPVKLFLLQFYLIIFIRKVAL